MKAGRELICQTEEISMDEMKKLYPDSAGEQPTQKEKNRYIRRGFNKCLAHVVEECGEVLAAAGKTQRWGRDSFNPEIPVEQQETNEDWLKRELQDLKGAIQRLEAEMP